MKMKATLTSPPPKRNTTSKAKTRKTLSEPPEKFKEMEDSFTIAQCQSNISFQVSLERPPLPKLIHQKLTLLPQRNKKKENKSHQNKTQRTLTKRKLNHVELLRQLLPTNKPGKPEAIEMLKPLKKNTGIKLKIKRMTSVSIEEFKPTVVLTTERDIKDGHKALRKEKPQMRAERSSSNTSKKLLTSLKLKILKNQPEQPKLPKWMLKTLRILSMRKPELDPAESP